jgi:hypothetical protein
MRKHTIENTRGITTLQARPTQVEVGRGSDNARIEVDGWDITVGGDLLGTVTAPEGYSLECWGADRVVARALDIIDPGHTERADVRSEIVDWLAAL